MRRADRMQDGRRIASRISSRSIFFIMMFIFASLIVPCVIAPSNNIRLSIDNSPINDSSIDGQGHLLTLHLYTALDPGKNGAINATSSQINNSLDDVDFSSIYDLTVLRDEGNGHQDSFKYFGSLEFPISYNIYDRGDYTFVLSRTSDGSVISENSFDYTGNLSQAVHLNASVAADNPDASINASIPVNVSAADASADVSLNYSASTDYSVNATPKIFDKCSNVFLKLERDEYLVGEDVKISFSNLYGRSVDTGLSIVTATSTYKFVGDLSDAVFVPSELGKHSIVLECDNIIIFNESFDVVTHLSKDYTDALNVLSNESAIISGNSASDHLSRTFSIKDSSGRIISKDVRISNIRNHTVMREKRQKVSGNKSLPDTGRLPDNVSKNSLKQAAGILSGGPDNTSSNLSINDSSSSINDSSSLISNSTEYVSLEVADSVNIGLSETGILNSSMTLDNLTLDPESDDSLYVEDVPRSSISFAGNVVSSYAMDLSNLNFTDGTFSKTAVGKELWKCADWNYTGQYCVGSWVKVMELNPGTIYNIEVSANDPGYIETGVSTVNTLKSLYYPDESVDISMVVLDTQGYLVPDANVTLTIISPNNVSTTLSTDDSDILMTHKGIYSANFTSTAMPGNYSMIIHAVSWNSVSGYVNSTMMSSFAVQSNHTFDILRNSSPTIDPNKEPFATSIVINANIPVSTFDYIETVPSSFEISDIVGGVSSDVVIVGNMKKITWYGLSSGSTISYSAKTPTDTPEVYTIGPGIVKYDYYSTNDTFIESRPWFLAIDPIFDGKFFMFWDDSSNAPPGWTCVSCNSGDPFYGRFIMGGPTFGITGGSESHNHVVTEVSETAGTTVSGGVVGADGEVAASGAHTHGNLTNAVTTNASNYPSFRQLKVIAYNGVGVPLMIPLGAIGIFNTSSLPANWTAYTAENGYFIFANATANTTGGNNTHTHAFNVTLISSSGVTTTRTTGTRQNVANRTHIHNLVGNTTVSANIPMYITVILAKATSNTSLPYSQGFIGMFNETLGDGWVNMSNSGQPFYNNIIMANSTYGATGGSNYSTHANVTIVSGLTPNITTTAQGASARVFATATHNHSVNLSFVDANITPPYITVMFGYAQTLLFSPPTINSIQCYRAGSGWIACTVLSFNNNLTAIRVNTTSNSPYPITNVSFSLYNLEHNRVYFNATVANSSSGYWIYNLTSFMFYDSGNYTLEITSNEASRSSIYDANWTVAWGKINVNLVYPTSSINVTRNRLFNFTVNLSCTIAECGNVSVLLDPVTSWWDDDWNYRRRINITNSMAVLVKQNYSIKINLDTTGGKVLANGSDVRIVLYNGTSWIEVDRVNESAFNSSSTEIWFKLQGNISANSFEDDYYVYYGNPYAGPAPSNKSNVYLWFDDFNRANTPRINTSEPASYTAIGAANWSINNSMLYITNASGPLNKLRINALGNSVDDVEMKMKFNITLWGGGSDSFIFGLAQYMDNNPAAGYSYNFLLRSSLAQVFFYNDATWGTGGAIPALSINSTYYMKYKFTNNTGVASGKIWSTNITEPGAWSLTGNHGAAGRNFGYVGITMANSGLVRAFIDDLQVRYILSTEPATSLSSEQFDKGIVPMYNGSLITPFNTLSNNPIYPSNDSCLVNMSMGESCIFTWIVNATGGAGQTWAFYTISNSTNFYSYVAENTSSRVNVTILGNIAPTVISAWITPDTPAYTENLNCSFIVTDPNVGDSLSATVNWYRNGIFALSTASGMSVTDGGTYTSTLSSSYLSIGDTWYCGVVPYDQQAYGAQTYSSNVSILASVPPVISAISCLKNNAIWVPCSSIIYNTTLSKVSANCTSRLNTPVSVWFNLTNVDDSHSFFSGTTYDNSSGLWVFDNPDVLITDSGVFNLSVVCADANGTSGYSSTNWTVPWGVLTVTLISPNSSINVTSRQFFNFTSRVTCTGGECGNINVTLDPYKEYFYSFENDMQGWTHMPMNGTANGVPAVGWDQWHLDTNGAKFGNYSWRDGPYDLLNYTTPPAAVLITPTFAIRTNLSNATIVSFYQYLYTENTWDGGKMEYSLDGGPWLNVTLAMFITGGYNGFYSINAAFVPSRWSNNDRIWTNLCIGPDPSCTVGTINNFSFVKINISSLKGENITFRFYMGGDNNGAGQGWFIDGFNITGWDYNPNKGIISMNASALPFYTTTQNPANYSNFSCLANMHAGDSCNTTWRVNASDVRGTYTFFVTYDSSYAAQIGEKNTTTINLTILLNTPPYVSSISLDPEYAVVGQNLVCSFTVRDSSQLDILGANASWYRNNALFSSINMSVQNGASYNITLGGGNLSSGDTWYCGIRPYDQQVWGIQVNSTVKTVLVGLPPQINSLQCLRNGTAWINCTALVFGDKFSGVRVNCTNVNAIVTNVSMNFSNTPDSKAFFNNLTTSNISGWWTFYYNMTIADSGEFVMQVRCNNNNSVYDMDNATWSLPWGKLMGVLVDPNSNVIEERNQFFTFTASVSCVGGECGNVTALLDPGFPPGSPANGTADNGSWYNPGGGDSSSGNYTSTWANDTKYYIVGIPGWGDAASQIILNFNISSLGLDAHKNFTSINISTSYCHSRNSLNGLVANGCRGTLPITKGFGAPQYVSLYNVNTSVWDPIGVLNVSDGERLVYDNFGANDTVNGTLTTIANYIDSSGNISVRFDMITGGSDTNPGWLALNYVMLTVTYDYIKGGAPVSTVNGTLPFYTTDPNPFNSSQYSCLENMSSLTGGCQVTWDVNASGRSNTTHEFWVVYNTSAYSNYVNPNSTSHIFITILDTTNVPPVVTLNSPAPNLATNNPNVVFNCSATDNRGLSRLSLYNNMDGTFIERDSSGIGGKNNITTFSSTLPQGVFLWNCMATDTDANMRFASSNRTLTVDYTVPSINLLAPVDTANISSRTVQLNFTVADNLDTSPVCNLTLDNVVNQSGFAANNGSMISKTMTNLVNGLHYWNVTCIDDAGNVNTSETRSFTVLSTPPIIVLQTIDNYMTNLSSLDLYYFTDDGGYITQADLYINGLWNQTDPGPDTGNTNTFSLSNVPEGAYTWTVNVTNDAGLTSQAAARKFYVILSAPSLNVTFPPDNYSSNLSSITFNFTAIDRFDSMLTCKIRINGVDVMTGINANNNTPTTRTVNNLKNGLNYWNITCQNDAGNANISQTRVMNISAPPTVSLGNPANNSFQSSPNITLYYTPTSGGNLSNCTLILNGVRNMTNSTISNGAQNNFKLVNIGQNFYNWSVNCTDSLGVTGSSTPKVFIIDYTAPYMTLNSPINFDVAYGGTTIFNFTAYDNLDPQLVCILYLDGAVNRTNIPSSNGQSTTVSVPIPVEANHTWKVNCSDHAFNTNVSITQNFTTINAPTVTLVAPSPNAYFNRSKNINFTFIPSSSNTLINATLYINGVPNTTVNGPSSGQPKVIFLNFTNDGSYNWSVVIVDNVGLVGISVNQSFTIDTIAPIVGIMTPSNGQTVNVNNVTFKFNVTDNLPGTMICNISVSGAVEWSNVSVAGASTITRYKVLYDGNYNWSVTCYDPAGNYNPFILTNFTVLAPPNITLNFPTPNYRTIMQNITFNYTPKDDIGFTNCSLYIKGVFNQSNSSPIIANAPNYFNIPYLAKGDYNWTVRCVDAAPDYNSFTAAAQNFTIDLTPPNISMFYPSEGQGVNNNSVVFNWTATDYPVNIACMLYVDGVYNQTVTQLSGAYFTPVVTNLTAGWHNWSLNCSDDLNNSAVGATVNFTVSNADLYLDTLRIYFNNSNPDENQTILIFANVSNIGGVPANNVLVDFYDGQPGFGGVFIGNATGSVGVGAFRIFNVSWNATPLFHTLYVMVDPRNLIVELNENNNNATRNFSILKSVIYAPSNGTMQTNKDLTINFTLTDYTSGYGSGLIDYIVFDGNSNIASGTVDDGDYNYLPLVGVLTEGVNNLRVQATDALGRRKNSTLVVVLVDTILPSIKYAPSNPSDNYVQSATSFTVNVTHTEANPDKVVLYWKLYNDLSYNSSDVRNYTGTAGSYTNFTFSGLDDGIYQYYVWANDTFGWTNQTAMQTMRIDLYPPRINLMSPSNGATVQSSSVELLFNVSDSSRYTNCTLYINGSANMTVNNFLTNAPQYFAQSFGDGSYSWYINCSDLFSRTNVSATRTFTVRNIYPTWNGTWYETYTSNWANATAMINLANVRDSTENNVMTTIGNFSLYTMAVATSSLFGGHGLLIPAGLVNFSGVFKSTGRDGYVTWKLYVTNQSGDYLIAQSGNDTTGPNNIPRNVRTTLSNSSSVSAIKLGPLDRFKLVVDIYNNAEAQDFTHYWDDRAESWFAFDKMYVIGDANVTLVQPNATIMVAPGYTFNLTCEVSCIFGTCMNTYVYAQYNSTMPTVNNWSNINSSGYLKLAGGQSNGIYLGNVSTGNNTNVTFLINTTSASYDNMRCYAQSDYNNITSGNIQSISVADMIPPVVVLDSPANNSFRNNATTIFYFNVTENIALDTCSLYLNNVLAQSRNSSMLSNNAKNNFTVLSMPEGLYLWNVTCNDTSNNIGSGNTSRILTIDYTIPSLTLISPANGSDSVVNTLNLSFNVSDNIASSLSCNVTLDNSVIRNNIGVQNASVYSTNVNGLSEGTHYWNVTCMDNSTNTNISGTKTFNVYNSPVITVVNPANNYWVNSSSVLFYFNVSDETGIQNCSVILFNGSTTALFTKTGSQLINNGADNITATGLSGIYNWSIGCYDNTTMRMYSVTSNRTLYVDLLAPNIYYVTKNSSWFNNQTPTISFNITDNMDTSLNYTIFVDGAINVNGTTNNGQINNALLGTLSEGMHTIIIQATDKASNIVNSSALTIYIDITLPRIRQNAPSPGFVNDNKSTVLFSFTMNDNMAANATCNLSISGGFDMNNLTAYNATAYIISVQNISGGLHFWNVTCMDLAGNFNNSPTRNFTILRPDLTLNSSDIVFIPATAIENQNVSLNVTLYNVGGNDAFNFMVQIFSGNPSAGGVQLKNYTLNMTSYTNTTLTANYTLGLGLNNIFVVLDPPLATNGSVNEENESNNLVNNSLYVSTWEYVLGRSNDTLVMADNSSIDIFAWAYSNSTGSNIYVADTDNNINWYSLKAIGMNMSNQTSMSDFPTIDTMLSSTNYSDSVNNTYTTSGSINMVTSFTVYGRSILQVPITNSTNNSNFMTGMLWDYSDANPGRYNGSQDLIFTTMMNKGLSGYNGTSDFEIRVPAKLRSYKGSVDTVSLYIELR